MRRVVKVGGSLLLRNDLLDVLPRWIARQGRAETLVIVGGGGLIDAIRHLDRVRGGDPIETHWMCVELLQPIYRIFSQWFDWPSISTPQALRAANKSGFSIDSPTIVASSAFYARGQACAENTAVPLDWRTTTDTIAALLANLTDADELVLLKSCDVDSTVSVAQLAKMGIVDEALPMIESSVKAIRVEKLT